MRLTSIAGSEERHECRQHDVKGCIWPRMGRGPGASTQCAYIISLLGERICPRGLQKRQRKDDERLDNIPPRLLSLGKRVGSHVLNLHGQVAHAGQETGVEEADAEIAYVGVDVAEAVARPPGCHVVVVPDEGIECVVKVLQLHHEDEHGGRQLSVAVEQSEGDEADEVAEEGQDDAADEVGREGWIGESGRGRTGREDAGSAARGDVEGRVHDGGLIVSVLLVVR